MKQILWEVLFAIKDDNEFTKPTYFYVKAKHGTGALQKARRELKREYPKLSLKEHEILPVILRPMHNRWEEYDFFQIMALFKDGHKHITKVDPNKIEREMRREWTS